ncbi:MAG: thymidylate synthase [Defluviitaleaceae bacterium]|nr:thymidylate synthase [Defluviitaleaceae bacterium]
MYEAFAAGKTLPQAYHKALLELYNHGKVVSCADYNQRQKELSMTIAVENPMAEPMVSRLYIGGFYELQQYVMEVLKGILDFKIGASENAWEYTYHDRIVNFAISPPGKAVSDIHGPGTAESRQGFNQLQFVIDELKRSPDTRRAVINIRDNSVDPFNANPACLQHIQFFIRDGRLHMKVLMRSNDAAEATFMNAFAFIMLQKQVADTLGIPVGSYTHRANSFHCYEKDFDLLAQYVNGIQTKPEDEITYEYEGFFRDMMEESIPDIERAVAKLK